VKWGRREKETRRVLRSSQMMFETAKTMKIIGEIAVIHCEFGSNDLKS
jgi:hypothetical protein